MLLLRGMSLVCMQFQPRQKLKLPLDQLFSNVLYNPNRPEFLQPRLRTATSSVSVAIHMEPADVGVDGTLYSYVSSTYPTWQGD